MATQIVKTFNPNGSGDNNFTTPDAVFNYIKSLDCVLDDINVGIVAYSDITWRQDIGPRSYSDTQRVTWYPAGGLGTNELNKTVFDVNASTSGLKIFLPRMEYELNITTGIDFRNMNLIVQETGRSEGIRFNGGHRDGVPYDNKWDSCRFFDGTTTSGSMIKSGRSSQYFQANSIFV